MDWFTWLSRTSLDPSHVYEYALTFAQNELEEDDIAYFSHEFLLSMGISTAKHRLEILKLARKERGRLRIHPIVWFMFAMKQTKTFLAKHIQTLFHRKNSGLYVVPARNHSLRWKVSMLQRNKKLRPIKTEWPTLRCESPMFEPGSKMLLLTDGSQRPVSHASGSNESPISVDLKSSDESTTNGGGNPWNSSFSSTLVDDGEYWSSSTEEIKWDSMFNLKPT